MKDKKLAWIIVLLCTIVIGIICGIYLPDSKINNTIDQVQTEIIKEIVVSEETAAEVADTKDAVENGGEVATVEIAEATIAEEAEVTDEGADESLLEQDALLEQENIEYNGDNTGKGINLLGKWTGLTYYSQADSRWATKLYTSTQNKTQTMKSSACGPTSAAMIVSSAKGAILPTTMASLSVENGFRTASSGTAWAFYPFVADYFGFKEYYTTSDFNTAMTRLGTDKNKDGVSDYFIIASCGSGLFTSGGHYIALVGLSNNQIRVYDPYLYTGKFTTASRKAANVKVERTSVYVTKDNFKNYANAKNFWIFSNDKGNEQKVETKKTNSKKDTKKTKIKNTVGKKKKLKTKCYIYKKKTLKGTKYTYLKYTTVKVLKNISATVDYVQVTATGRKGYINNKYYK